jgi:hypothetical protein
LRDTRAIAGREQIEADKQSDEVRDAKYRADLARWGERMAGPPPPGYVKESKRRAQHEDRDAIARPAPAPPVYPTGCKQNGSSVHCNKSDGSVSYGSVDAFGNGRVHAADGSSQQIRRDPFGHEKTEDGTCVKDLSGQCQ